MITSYKNRLPKAQDGRVIRAANANLSFWERCRQASSADNGGGGINYDFSGSGKPKYANAYEEISDINDYDKDQRKQFKSTLPKGVDIKDWVAFNRDANRLNAQLSNPAYSNWFDSTGTLVPDKQKYANNMEPWFLYYKPAFMGKSRVSPEDIMKFHMSQPNGVAGYKDLVNRRYMPQQRDGGSNYSGTYSGGVYYQEGGQAAPVPIPYSRETMRNLADQYAAFYAPPHYYGTDDGFDAFFREKSKSLPNFIAHNGPAWKKTWDDGMVEYIQGEKSRPIKSKPGQKVEWVDDYTSEYQDDAPLSNQILQIMKNLQSNKVKPAYQRSDFEMGGAPCYECGGMYQDGGQSPKYKNWEQPEDDVDSEENVVDGDEDETVENLNNQNVAAYPGSYSFQPATQGAPAQGSSAPAQGAAYNGVSIVDYLNSKGLPSNAYSRKKLAAQLGIRNYTGQPGQNIQLLHMLQRDPGLLKDYAYVPGNWHDSAPATSMPASPVITPDQAAAFQYGAVNIPGLSYPLPGMGYPYQGPAQGGQDAGMVNSDQDLLDQYQYSPWNGVKQVAGPVAGIAGAAGTGYGLYKGYKYLNNYNNGSLYNNAPSNTAAQSAGKVVQKDATKILEGVAKRGYRTEADYEALAKAGFKPKEIMQKLKGVPFKETVDKAAAQARVAAERNFTAKLAGENFKTLQDDAKNAAKAYKNRWKNAEPVIMELEQRGVRSANDLARLRYAGLTQEEAMSVLKGFKFETPAVAPAVNSGWNALRKFFAEDAGRIGRKVLDKSLQNILKGKEEYGGPIYAQDGASVEPNMFHQAYDYLNNHNVLDMLWTANPLAMAAMYAAPEDFKKQYGLSYDKNPLNKNKVVRNIANFGQYALPYYGEAKIAADLGTALGSNKLSGEDKFVEAAGTVLPYGVMKVAGRPIKAGIKAARKLTGFQQGGQIQVGQEMEVTPEQMRALRKQGYKFDII